MLACEYSSSLADGSASNASNRWRSLARSASRGALGREPRRHALDRRPHHDHLEDLGFRLAHHEHAAARDRADQALLLEIAKRLADRRAADAEILAELTLVEPDLAPMAVDVHLGDGPLDRIGRELAESCARIERTELEQGRRCRHRPPGDGLAGRRWPVWYLVYRIQSTEIDAASAKTLEASSPGSVASAPETRWTFRGTFGPKAPALPRAAPLAEPASTRAHDPLRS